MEQRRKLGKIFGEQLESSNSREMRVVPEVGDTREDW